MAISKILIVGAGPSGLLLALMLARAGISVELLEMTTELDKNPRASHYAAPACYELQRAGVLEEVRRLGFLPNSVSWRKLDENKTRLTGIRNADMDADDPLRMVCLTLDRLGKILQEHVKAQPNAKISYNYKVTGLGQDESQAWVDAAAPEGPKRMTADYIIGCDGANSQIRRGLFGDFNFPGRTWDEQIVATNVYYDFPEDYDDSNFFIHPEHWHMVAKIGTDGLYRVSYGEIGGLTTEQLRERLPYKFKAMFPGHPKPSQYNVVNFSPYKIHQRCAERMRAGRFLLVADAAHLCNPFGGMGLTGGIADVGSLYDSLVGIHIGQADDSILDKYDEIRRKIWHEIIDPISSGNIRRLFGQDADEALEKDDFLKMLKRAETDKELSLQMQAGAMSLRHDMTQYYRKPADSKENVSEIRAKTVL
ncbi:FAD/NAD(P)-binding domain-containing protein [Rhizodiscina lignyota]|uniref:FAD/NAD(P)-binding domain-containing protein n=1 Tax=Rhizodiscina lignyota TaxID=1504668 RepID=A0A9P4IIE9_9PEZI|nr:FAD/NAD(P)-binding domain-containing protein [Rhizodiscina lignyota]